MFGKKRTIGFVFGILISLLVINCRFDESGGNGSKIEEIVFNPQSASIQVGQEISVKVTATPPEGKANENISYKASQDGIITISETSKDGFIIKGENPGNVVVIAKSSNVTSYMEVKVTGGDFVAKPYIMVSQPVVEINEGEQRVMNVSLYGGSVLDNHEFTYYLEENKSNIRIETTGNTIVVHGEASGNQRIKIQHPKAEYESEILVFVKKVDEQVKFITSEKNIVMFEVGVQYNHVTVALFGSSNPTDVNAFQFEVIEGNEIIEIIPNNEVCNIRVKEAGSGVIRVRHPLAEVDFIIRVIGIVKEVPVITVDKTFALIGLNENVIINAAVENPLTSTALNEFSYEIIESSQGVVHIIQTNNQFFVQGLAGGTARIIVKNEQAEYSREVLVVVRTETVYRDDYYITTSQNIIQAQVGDKDIILSMLLVGGVPSDANSFEWEVSDGNIIEVSSAHGTVTGNERATVDTVFNAIALITPKRVGTSKIKISHPKSEAVSEVLVKVYPANTFSGPPILVKTEGLLKVLLGTPKQVNLEMVSGAASEIGELEWAIDDGSIANLDSSLHGLTNMINGARSGQTKLKVSGGNLRNPHESIVLVGTQAELDGASLIYVDSIYQKVATEQVVRVEVKDSQGMYRDSGAYKVEVTDGSKLYAIMVKSQLILQGKSPGETTVKITHPEATNEIVMTVRVENERLTFDTPYYIDGPDMVGLVNGTEKKVMVDLVGATAQETGKLLWKIEDSSVAEIIANGEELIIRAKSVNKQTNVTVSHGKSENVKTIVVYTVATEAELGEKIVIAVEKRNYLLTDGEEVMVNLITNASDADKAAIQWDVKTGLDVVSVDGYATSAMVRAFGIGNAEVVVTHPQNILPLSVYFSVAEERPEEKSISFPSILELLIGDSKVIEVTSRNLSTSDKAGISWQIEDSSVASIEGNGESAYIIGLKKGITYVNIKQAGLGYEQRVTVLCAETRAELENMYVMGVSSTYYKMKIGEEKRINLQFGSAGFPEVEKPNIVWEASQNNVVKVSGNGDNAVIIAENEGVGVVEVKSGVSENTLKLTFEVSREGVGSELYEIRGYERIKGLLIGNSHQITLRMYKGDTEITSGYSLFEVENEKNTVAQVNMAGNVLDIKALSAGQSYITVRHPRVLESARILIYTASTQAELNNYYPIIADKTNFLIQIGEEVEINLITETSKDSGNVDKISWGIENSSVVTTTIKNKKNVLVKGRSIGEAVLNVSFNGTVVQKIYVSVVDNTHIDLSKRINTENIIGLLKGEERVTTISTNLTPNELSNVLWESGNIDLVTVSGSGASATLTATGTILTNNETYVTVKYGEYLKRHILVFVCETKEELDAYKAMNMENQYVRLGRNETVRLPLYYAPNKPEEDTVWVDKYNNEVASLTALENGDKIEVTGLNEGVAVFEARNAGRSNTSRPVELYVEVSNEYVNVNREPELKYLTTNKTIYVLNPDEPGKEVEIRVNGIGLSPAELQKIKWEKNNNFISVFPNGELCKILPNEEGETTLRVFHPSTNILEIKVIVSRDPEVLGYPRILFDDIVRLGLNEVRNIELKSEGIAQFNPLNVEVSSDKEEILEVGRTGSLIRLTGKSSGQAQLTIKYPGVFDKQVVVIVTASEDGLIYLTTSDNFSILHVNEYKNVKVNLVGFEETSNSRFKWTVAPGYENIIGLSGSGSQAQVQGKEIGTARIDITHEYAMYPLSIYVRVSDVDKNPVYISTRQNIISLVEKKSMNIEVQLMNGQASEEMLFVWENLTPEIISLNATGKTGLIQGKMLGVGRIRVSHPSCLNTIDIVSLVEEDATSSGIYITTDSTLIEMKPTDGSRRVGVRLVGGQAEDIYGFKWEVVDYNSIEKWPDGTSKPVIDLTPGSDSAFVNAKNEGEATIRVTHPKTSYKLDIKVDVKFNTAIAFARNNLSMDMGNTTSVEVASPTGSKVIYEVSDSSVLKVSGTNKVAIFEAIKDGTVIVTARNPQGTLSDEIIVVVRFVENAFVKYIETPTTLLTVATVDEPVRVSAKVVGTKGNGVEFTDIDNNELQWVITEEEKRFVSVYPSTGGEVAVTPKAAGDVELQVRHPAIPGYVKRIYVKVTVDDVVFRLSKVLMNMQVEDVGDVVTAEVQNVSDVDYERDIVWENVNPDIVELHSLEENKSCYIVPRGVGEATVRVIYNGSTVRTVSVFVSEPKSLNIVGSVRLLPGQVAEIPYTVIPETAQVIVESDYYDYVDIKHDEEANKLILTGKNSEGSTVITLKANGIEKVLTVDTNFSYTFKWKEITSLRGRPYDGFKNGVLGGPYVIKYDVEPAGDPIVETLKSREDRDANGANPLLNIQIDSGKQEIIVHPLRAGYTTLVFESPYNKDKGTAFSLLELPTYFYYENIQFGFKIPLESCTPPIMNGDIHSKIVADNSISSLYLGDGEKGSIVLDIDENMYPGHSIQILNAQLSPSSYPGDLKCEFWHDSQPELPGKAVIRFSVDSAELDSPYGYDQRQGSDFAGILKIMYQYYNGDTEPRTFVKSYLTYIERWYRRSK